MNPVQLDQNGSMKIETIKTTQGVQVDVKDQIFSINTGEIYGDIMITFVIGIAIVLSIFSYGYFFGTRNVEARVELARKIEREKFKFDRRMT